MAASLAPTLLLSMPQLVDPNFSKTVVLLCKHDDEGAFGLSTSLQYVPGRYASTAEIVVPAMATASARGLASSMVRTRALVMMKSAGISAPGRQRTVFEPIVARAFRPVSRQGLTGS